MPEAVIVDAVRTPIGRAFKGSLASLRPDETLAHVIDEVLERNPGIDPATVEEVIAGCGQPQGLQANNIARIAVLLSDKLGQQTNGSTISRYCSSGLDAIRIAANNIIGRTGRHLRCRGRGVRVALQRLAGGRAPRGPARGPAGQERQEQRKARRVHRDGSHRGERRGALRRHARTAGRVRPALPGARGGRPAERVLRSRDRARPRQRHRGGPATTARGPRRRSRSCGRWSPRSRRAAPSRRATRAR